MNRRKAVTLSRNVFSSLTSTTTAGRQQTCTTRAHTISQKSQFDEETDVLIVGSGAAGLTASLRCQHHSLQSLLVEKTDVLGGTTAYSGGGLWVPNNRFTGSNDSTSKTLTYMDKVIGDVGPASSAARREAFVREASRMLEFLISLGFEARASGTYPNYYPWLEGGDVTRSVESVVFDSKKLGSWEKMVRQRELLYPPCYTDEASRLFRIVTSVSNMLFGAKTLGLRTLNGMLFRRKPVTMGPGLVSQLLYLNVQQNARIRCSSPLKELIIDNGKVAGAIISMGSESRPVRVRTRKGILLAAGGFARNSEMRKKYQQGPITTDWTMAQTEDTGDAIRLGQDLGAQVALMDDAWWGCTIVDPETKARHWNQFERSLPYSIIVDASGQRFMNEALPYTDAGHEIYKRNQVTSSIPAWMILDSRHRKRYPLADLMPGKTPESRITSGFIYKDKSLEGLCSQIGVDAHGLHQTVDRFNEMARNGIDEDFGRGQSIYDQFFADPNVKPHGNLGSIEKGPFYAVKIWPGDLGTKGGLLTDENARVIGTSGKPIEGLYAAGNTTASVMGRSYPGPGSTLGPALTFSYIAVNHMAETGS